MQVTGFPVTLSFFRVIISEIIQMYVGFISSSYRAVDFSFVVWVLMRKQSQMYM